MKKFILLLTLLTLTPTFAAGPDQSLPGDRIKVGKVGSTDKTIEAMKSATSATNPKIKWNNTLTSWQFSNDGTNYLSIGSGSGSANNILTNGGFETSTTGWSASGGTFTTTTTAANVGFGTIAGSWDSSASSQTLTSTATAIPAGAYGRNGVASCVFQGAGATHTIQAYDGTNILASTTITSQAAYSRTSVNFIFPSSGNISLRIVSVNANEPIIYIDDCFLGPADSYNISQVSQANLVGSAYFAATASCTFTRTSTSLGAFLDTDCPGATVESNPGLGTIQTTDFDAPKVAVNNLPAGNYVAHFIGANYITVSTQAAAMAINDGTTTAGQATVNGNLNSAGFHISAPFTYTTSGNRTFELYGSSAANAIEIPNAASNQRLYFYLERFPSAGEIAYRPDISNAVGSIKYIGATSCLWSTTSATQAAFAADTDCSTPTTTGSASAPGTKIPGGVFSNIPAGKYLAVAQGKFETDYTTSTTQCLYQLYDGTNAIGFANGYAPSGNTIVMANTISGVVNYSSFQSSITLQVRAMRAQGGGTCFVANDTTDQQLEIMLIPLDQGRPNPLLVGGYTSNNAGTSKLCGATLNCDGSSAITSDPDGCVASIGNISAGACAITFNSGYWSGNPKCQFFPRDNTVNLLLGQTTGATSSGVTVRAQFQAFSAAAGTWSNSTGHDMDMWCSGPR